MASIAALGAGFRDGMFQPPARLSISLPASLHTPIFDKRNLEDSILLKWNTLRRILRVSLTRCVLCTVQPLYKPLQSPFFASGSVNRSLNTTSKLIQRNTRQQNATLRHSSPFPTPRIGSKCHRQQLPRFHPLPTTYYRPSTSYPSHRRRSCKGCKYFSCGEHCRG